MAVAYASQGAAQLVIASTVSLAKPTGLAVGDTMVVFLFTSSATSPTISMPSGWATAATTAFNAANGGLTLAACKVADASDVAASTFTFTGTGGSVAAMIGWISRYTGGDPTTPTNGTSTAQSTQTGTTGNFPSMTTTIPNSLVVHLGIYTYAATPSGSEFPNAVPAGTTIDANGNNPANSFAFAALHFTQVTAGATGAKTVPINGARAANIPFEALTLALTPLISGTLAATEAKDTAALTGNISSGTLAVTEPKDVASLTGDVASVGTLAATETADAAAIAATVGTPITGTLAATETPDGAAITASVGSSGTLAAVEPKDSASITASVGSAGSLAAIEAKDVAAISASIGVSGALASTEGADAASITVALSITGSVAATETGDTASILASLPAMALLAANEGPDHAAIIALAANDDVTPPERIVYPAHEVRTARAIGEPRLVTVAAENRTAVSNSAARDAQAA